MARSQSTEDRLRTEIDGRTLECARLYLPRLNEREEILTTVSALAIGSQVFEHSMPHYKKENFRANFMMGLGYGWWSGMMNIGRIPLWMRSLGRMKGSAQDLSYSNYKNWVKLMRTKVASDGLMIEDIVAAARGLVIYIEDKDISAVLAAIRADDNAVQDSAQSAAIKDLYLS